MNRGWQALRQACQRRSICSQIVGWPGEPFLAPLLEKAGEHTRPSDIERALVQDFSANTDLARKQRLALMPPGGCIPPRR